LGPSRNDATDGRSYPSSGGEPAGVKKVQPPKAKRKEGGTALLPGQTDLWQGGIYAATKGQAGKPKSKKKKNWSPSGGTSKNRTCAEVRETVGGSATSGSPTAARTEEGSRSACNLKIWPLRSWTGCESSRENPRLREREESIHQAPVAEPSKEK